LSIINTALTIFLTAGVIAALIAVIWSGIQWTTSEGDKQKVAQAKARLTWGIIGLIIIMLSFFIINVFGYFFGVDLLKINF
jgi:Type IV secretion system pilin